MFWIILFFIAVDYPLFKIFYKWIFPTTEDLEESVRYSFTPDIISLFRGEYRKDRVSEGRLALLVLLCVGLVALEVAIVAKLFHL